MILNALHDLYGRFEQDEFYEGVLPSFGYTLQRIAFMVVLEEDGSFFAVQPLRTQEIDKKGKTQTVDRWMLVPGGDKPTGALTAKSVHEKTLFLRNDCRFLLGVEPIKKGKDLELRTNAMPFEAFRDKHLALAGFIQCQEFHAVCSFFESWNADVGSKIQNVADIATAQGKPAVGVFCLRNGRFVHDAPAVRNWWEAEARRIAETDSTPGSCMVTFTESPIARLHTPKIKGIGGKAQPSGTLLVSFDKDTDAYASFGGDGMQAYNAPVSIDATFKYCAALSTMTFGPASTRHRVQIGDTATVFWTETSTEAELALSAYLGASTEQATTFRSGNGSQLLQALHGSLRSISHGGRPDLRFAGESDKLFHILGLTGQAGGRIGIRFYHRSTIGELLRSLAKHHADLAMVPEWGPETKHPDPEFPPVWRLLRQTARETKEIPPNLPGALMRSILQGIPYPTMLADRVLSRIRTPENDRNGKPQRRVTYLRAAILKAFLNRNQNKKMTESLDPTRTEPAYHLGRLFAVYETAQKHAHDWKLERTIRETMYSSASATPLAVFGRLERLHHHHTAKRSHPRGSSDSYADIVAEIDQHFKRNTPVFPATLGLIDQSLFAVGYYHQLQHFKHLSNRKKETTESNS